MGIHTLNGARSERAVSDNERFHLNHYVLQSLEYFEKVKVARGDATKAKNDHLHNIQYFESHNAAAILPDHLLADLVASSKIH